VPSGNHERFAQELRAAERENCTTWTIYPPRDRSVAALLCVSLTADATDLHSLACDRPWAGQPAHASTPDPKAPGRPARTTKGVT